MLPEHIDGFTSVQVLHEGRDTILYRCAYSSDPTSKIILKAPRSEYPLQSDIARLRHEFEIAQLFDSPVLVKALDFTINQGFPLLVLEDFGGTSLDNSVAGRPLALESFLSVALQMATALEAMHRQHVIHRDIKSANVICNDANIAKIADFGIASQLPRHNPVIASANVFKGTLAYVSPEQTGRMNRLVDYRTDFYSLGITFYEMLTGALPFTSRDPVALMHAHIARQPAGVDSVNPAVPKVLSAIVMRLLEKNAEDRYQNASGLIDDLQRCRDTLTQSSEIAWFEPGLTDVSEQLRIPQKLYGRDTEIEQLLQSFERVSNGSTELMLVSGASGVGKSALISEIHRPVSAGGYFISGKFDQYRRNVPFSSLISAFQSLVQQLLGESAADLDGWKHRLQQALGPNGAVITEVIPEVELIIGRQPEVPQLAPVESQNRFNLVFRNFVRVFAARGRPLAIFLDDLQWADSASLNLIATLLGELDTRHIMLIVAYRDNEVSDTHPLVLMLDGLEQDGATTINRISLGALLPETVQQIVAETLVPTQMDVAPLSALVFEKTAGSPFFVNIFLNELYVGELLQFARRDDVAGWQWDLDAVAEQNLTQSAVQMMTARIERLSAETRTVLQVAACIGNEFDLQTLAVVCGHDIGKTAGLLWGASEQGLILGASGNDLETLSLLAASESDAEADRQWVSPRFRFLHDQIQQAAYQLLTQQQRQQRHYQIGNTLLQAVTDDNHDEHIFDLVNQLNQGISYASGADERIRLARLNLAAGLKAKSETAYEAVCEYVDTGLSLLPEDGWQSQPALTTQLHMESIEAAFSASRFEQAEAMLAVVFDRDLSVEDRVRLFDLKIQLCMVQERQLEAIEAGLEALELLGISLASQEYDVAKSVLPLPALETLGDRPEMTDPGQLAAFRIMMTLTPVIHHVNPELFPKLALSMIRFCLDKGHSELAAWGYVIYGLFLCDIIKDLPRAFHAGQIALDLVDRYYNKAIKIRTLLPYYVFVHASRGHCAETFEPLVSGVQNALEVGDVEFAGYYVMAYGSHLFLAGTALEEVAAEQAKYIGLTQSLKNDYAAHYSQSWGQLTLNLQGKSGDPVALDGEHFDHQWVAEMHDGNNLQSLYAVYVCKLILAYTFGRYDQALEHAREAEKHLPAAFGLMKVAAHRFYHCLAVLASADDGARASLDADDSALIDAHLQQLAFWAEHSPGNFLHKHQLVLAEKYRVEGSVDRAIELYQSAIANARQQGFLQDEALGCELLGGCYLAAADAGQARVSLDRAHKVYLDWGALAKAQWLQARYSDHIDTSSAGVEERFGVADGATVVLGSMVSQSSNSASGHGNLLDLSALMKASQAISGEISLDSLLSRLLEIVNEIAGAQRAVMLLSQGGQWCIEAESNTEHEIVSSMESRPIGAGDSALVASSIVNFVSRSQQTVVLEDAVVDDRYSADPYIARHQSRSLLCLPLINQGQLRGILYLENNLATNAFTAERLEMLNTLSSQAAISIENATLYQTLEQRVEARTAELASANEQIGELNERLAAENRRMGGELEVTQRLQKMMLPRSEELLRHADLDIAGYMEPAEEVGGDYYDVLSQDDRVVISMADVSGHGLESGVVMLMMQTAVRTMVSAGQRDLSQILDVINRTVYANIQRMSVDKNATLVLLDFCKGALNICGQHEELLVFRADGGVEIIDTNDLGLPIGMDLDIEPFLRCETLQLGTGDGVVLYTDGITEAENPAGRQYSLETLCAVVSENWARSAREISDSVIGDLRNHIGSQTVYDDITLLVLKYV